MADVNDTHDPPASGSIPRQRADRRQLQQIIAGLTEGVILIDPDQSLVWANEAALVMHGAADLDELGGTVTGYRTRYELRYRNNHLLPAGNHPIEKVLAGEASHDAIVEVARAGDEGPRWVHWVRSLVLTDAAGLPESLVLVVQDVTERFGAEERFERAFNANPAPAVICRLSDLRYVKVNQGFEEMTGHVREHLIGRTIEEIDVLEGAERRELALERLREGRTVPQMEATLSLPRGGTKLVIVAGQPIEMGDEPCMLFTFADLEPRKEAEDALRQSEERFAKAFRMAPVPTLVCAMDGFRVLDANEAFTAATGYTGAEVLARSPAEVELWGSAAARRQLEQEIERTGTVRGVEIALRTKGGELLDCLVSAETVTIHGEPCLLLVLQDITERKRSEGELVAAIEAVMQDTSWFTRTVLEKLAILRQPRAATQATKTGTGLAELTARERDVLGLMCQGLGDEEIARKLHVSRHTVRNHVATIYRKLDVHRRSSAIVWARERGLGGTRAGS